ncbi:DNA translocase FtsK [Bosea sp. 117]|uniref:DNA translocase FtsK n=1 Tax=Bosea sp. 117 TaxID=1125973 RepID=UPI00068B03DB|nr:DNA translocase FtsK [Bosea sp. 117]
MPARPPKPAAAAPAEKGPVPSWLQPFTMPSNTNTRFTRTPDYLLRAKPEPYATPSWEPVIEPAAATPPAIVPNRPPLLASTAIAARLAAAQAASDAAPSAPDPVAAVAPAEIADEAEMPPEAHEPASDGQPASVRRIASLIRLDWDAPPAESASDLVAETPETPAAPPPATELSAGGLHASFAWPIFAAPIVPAYSVPEAPIQPPVAIVPAPQPAPEARRPAPAPIVAPAAPVAAPRPAPAMRVEPPPARANAEYEFPPIELLAEPPQVEPDFELSEEYLDRNSVKLQQVLHDFGVRGEIIDANPGPVVTLYELEPAPGIKSSRVIGLAADIARSMSAVSARVAVVEGRNVIGIELPNQRRETVWLREMLSSHDFEAAKMRLAIALGKTIGGEPVIVDLARMPHLLVAGTTGSGKSVAINTMILSLLYRHRPEQCRLIMIDPKMLELSVYEGIPHLLTPVVTDPKKAIIALKWAVREMEERYKKMSRLGVRNIDGYNARVTEARERGEIITRTVQTGFDRETGQMTEEEEIMDLSSLPYIVVVVDEMADLMMVAGKDIEGAIQRLAQMARAAGIHLIMATQRPSVDVITGTIKANFPTRISFQVTSKIDSRTILGEMGAEQLLGQGDMLYMAGGGRISRTHGPFVSDQEVEKVVAHLKRQGKPDYVDAVTADDEEESLVAEEDEAVFDKGSFGEEGGGDLYDQAVAIVQRDRKASTSYIQRRLQIGYNRAASIMERMENEGLVGAANHAGKREILDGR